MKVLLTNISFVNFISIENKKQYIGQSELFTMKSFHNKKDAISWLRPIIDCYPSKSTKPLYVTFVKDNYWYKVSGDLGNSITISNLNKFMYSNTATPKNPVLINYNELDKLCDSKFTSYMCVKITIK